MKTVTTLLLAALTALPLSAQSVVECKGNYLPQGRNFVCENGNNRYTRALYGSRNGYRLETSDRPIFAIYKKNDNRNIRFKISYQGSTVQLDSTSYCKASYTAGRRDYVLHDSRWGQGEVELSLVSFLGSEGGIWKVTARGFKAPVKVDALICETSTNKMVRNGDIGNFRNPKQFDAPSHPEHLQTVSQTVNEKAPQFFLLEDTNLTTGKSVILSKKYDEADKARLSFASTVEFNTPDPYLNPIGGAMVVAADGAWDGTVWNHGAVGWRMPLPGWRAAYMGDFLGMFDRQRIHFTAYGNSQVTNVPATIPHPTPDPENNLARGLYKWGTPMYSNGYICRAPNKNNQFNHYDMNLVYIDELLWHFQFDADTTYMRQMWPVIKRHLAWEKLNWDPDNDGLYDAYCCIWASDALQYNSGAGTHSSAYNYRGNLLAARVAEIIGEDPTPYRIEADKILKAMNKRLWLDKEGHWVEFQDFMGLKRQHKDAALWSIYTPIDCGSCSDEQAYRATRYIDRDIPHIPFRYNGKEYATVSTTDWMPYDWSINNVAMGEVMHTVLAYYQAGRTEEAYKLLKSCVLDFMYLGSSPGNFGQISQFDRALGESYRDFSDVTGISSRAFIQGLYGITPDALYGRCIIRPGFPAAWDSASIHTPYLDYSFKRVDGKEVYCVKQHFAHPLQIVIRQNIGNGKYVDTPCTADSVQTITLPIRPKELEKPLQPREIKAAQGTAFDQVKTADCRMVNIDKMFNSSVTDIFKNEYLTPRSPYTTLSLPKQGIGDWCSTKRTAKIDDTHLRELATNNVFNAVGIPFRTPQEGSNIAYTSLWDNYPDSLTFALKGKASHAYLMMAGSTNPMQSRIANGCITVTYTDGSSEYLELGNPDNWCPIEQDYADDGKAFRLAYPRPYRVGLSSGKVSRTLFEDLHLQANKTLGDQPSSKQQMLFIPGGAAQLIDMPLNPKKKLRSLTLRTLANDVVMGVMSITLQK